MAPCGSGKTVMVSAIVAKTIAAGGRALALSHRRELVEQTAAKLWQAGVTDLGLLLPGHAERLEARTQVGSIQTLTVRAMHSRRIELPPADILFIDEFHHLVAPTWRAILELYPSAIVVGASATPSRADGRGLGSCIDVLVEAPPVVALIELGILVQTRVFAPFTPDLRGVRIRHGDYAEEQLAERMDRPKLTGDIVMTWLKRGERRRTVAFATGVAHALHLRNAFRDAGVLAEHIDGTTPIDEREEILAKLAAGTIEVLCNAMVLCEGWDSPAVSCLILARPTKSMPLYRQMVGRVIRSSPGKRDAVVCDHSGATLLHGLIEDKIHWTLAPGEKARNLEQIAREQHRTPGLATCPECGAVRKQGQPCPSCGWRPQRRPVAVETAEGELYEVGRAPVTPLAISREQFYRELAWYATRHNHKAGWIAWRFKARYGDWPPRSWNGLPPLVPSDATLRWIRSQNIAYARAQRAAG